MARSHLDRVEQIEALLAAATALDGNARADRQHVPRRTILATLTFAGLRVGEALDLRWRDVDLAAGRIHVRQAKTDAGVRHVQMLPVLRSELLAWKMKVGNSEHDDRVFATRPGGRISESAVRNRILAPAVKKANAALAAVDRTPLPEGLTPHGLRRTFASILVAIGEDPRYVMDQLGHTDPAFTLRLYAQAMRRDDQERDRLRALVDGGHLADIGRQPIEVADSTATDRAVDNEETPD